MTEKTGNINFNLKDEEFNSLVINKLSEMQASIKKLRADIFNKVEKDEQAEKQIMFNLSWKEFTMLVVNKLADIQSEFDTMSSVLTALKALRKNERDENAGNIFRSNDDDENLGGALETLLEKNRVFRHKRRLSIIAEMIKDYASDPGSGLPDNGIQFSGPQNN